MDPTQKDSAAEPLGDVQGQETREQQDDFETGSLCPSGLSTDQHDRSSPGTLNHKRARESTESSTDHDRDQKRSKNIAQNFNTPEPATNDTPPLTNATVPYNHNSAPPVSLPTNIPSNVGSFRASMLRTVQRIEALGTVQSPPCTNCAVTIDKDGNVTACIRGDPIATGSKRCANCVRKGLAQCYRPGEEPRTGPPGTEGHRVPTFRPSLKDSEKPTSRKTWERMRQVEAVRKNGHEMEKKCVNCEKRNKKCVAWTGEGSNSRKCAECLLQGMRGCVWEKEVPEAPEGTEGGNSVRDNAIQATPPAPVAPAKKMSSVDRKHDLVARILANGTVMKKKCTNCEKANTECVAWVGYNSVSRRCCECIRRQRKVRCEWETVDEEGNRKEVSRFQAQAVVNDAPTANVVDRNVEAGSGAADITARPNLPEATGRRVHTDEHPQHTQTADRPRGKRGPRKSKGKAAGHQPQQVENTTEQEGNDGITEEERRANEVEEIARHIMFTWTPENSRPA